jgi:hypothetical protein
MRLRRKLAIAAAAAAAAVATTAAAFPSAPVDRPQPFPALTAQALAARYATDSRMIARAARAAARSGNQGLARSLGAMRGEHFIDFNPAGPGLAVEVIGDLATARRVAVLVPGLTRRWPRSTPGARPHPRARPPPWPGRSASWTRARTWLSSPGSATPRPPPSARP